MNTLLLFFALPVATIILAIALEKVLQNSVLTAAVFFAVYLIITFAIFDTAFLIFTIIYTILAFLTAIFEEYILKKYRYNDIIYANNIQNCNNNSCSCNNQETATANIINNMTGRRSTWCCYRKH